LKGNNMDRKEILSFLRRCEAKMDDDYAEGRWGKYPPLYSKDYLFGKLKAVKEMIQRIEA
jgi:hypothetical protein